MIDLALFLKRNGYRPDQVQDFIPAPFDVATCMYYTGLDPFTGEEVYIAGTSATASSSAPAPVLQARELLRRPRGPLEGRPLRPDRLRLRRPDPRPAPQGRPPRPHREGRPRAGRRTLRPHHRDQARVPTEPDTNARRARPTSRPGQPVTARAAQTARKRRRD